MLDFSNYPPISLLSYVEKILNQCIINRIFKFFHDHKLINPLQFGFRQKHSSIHALINLTENVTKNLDEVLAVVFLFTYKKHLILYKA